MFHCIGVRKKFDKIVPVHVDFEDFSWFNEEHKHCIERVAKWIIESDTFDLVLLK